MTQLPLEVWVRIFQYLPFEGIKACSAVNRSFRSAINLAFPVSEDNESIFKLRLYADDLEKQSLNFKWLNSWFNAIHLCDMNDTILLQLCQTFEHSAYRIQTLILDKCCFSWKNLFCLLNLFPNLKTLQLVNFTCSTQSSEVAGNIDGIRKLEITLPSVSVCSVGVVSYLLKSCTNLRQLSLSSFRFFIDHYMQTKHDTQMISASSVINVVKISATTLRSLELCECNATNWMVNTIVKLPELSLTELKLNSCSEITSQALENVVSFQPNLEVLELAKCVQICDLKSIEKLKNLRRLNLAKLAVTSEPDWGQLPNLEWLSLAHSFNRMPNIFNNVKIKYLDLNGIGVTPRSPFSRFPSNTPSYSLISFTNLQELHLSNCTQLPIAPVFDLEHLIVLDLSWNSEVYDSLLLDVTPRCKNLQDLSLRQNKNLTDIGVSYIITQLPSLRRLDLGLIDRLTDITLDVIARSLPLLVSLNISQCCQVTGQGLAVVLSGCKQLRSLNIAVCNSLDSKDLFSIPKYNHFLQELDLSMNHHVTEEVAEHLTQKLPFLRSLNTNYCFH